MNHSWRLQTSCSMKREALRTESDTSQIVISFGFSRCRRLRKISIGTAPHSVPLSRAQRQRVLDLAPQPGDDALHLGDLVRRQRKERLVREHLARELLA